jgi:hypothetical protein
MRRVALSLFAFSLLAAGTASSASGPSLRNPGFEESAAGPVGWGFVQHAGVKAYEVALDHEVVARGERSLRVRRHEEQVFGLVRQVIDLPPAEGRRLEYSAMLRTEAVGPGGWYLEVVLETEGQGFLGRRIIETLRSERVSGDSEWRRVGISQPIPAEVARLSVAIVLRDGGTGWADDVNFAIVGP